MKKLLSLVLVLVLATTLFVGVGCGKSNTSTSSSSDAKAIKIGCIMIGDETEGYTKAHIDGIRAAAQEVGIDESSLVWKYSVPESDECTKTAEELVAQGCSLIIANSYGHQDFITKAAEKYPKVNFVSMTGDHAAITGYKNLFNAFTNVYEARYVSGVVAGMKIKELAEAKKIDKKFFDKDGNVKIGYVGAFPYAEVVSGYTAFYLGAKSVYEKVAMEVTYTSSWFDIEAEAAAAESLMKDNCLVIGQHADSTGSPSACQKAKDNGTMVYSVGYNVDMLPVAKTAALTSPTNTWAKYYTELFKAVLDGKEIPQDWAKGYNDDAVCITELGPEVAEGTDAKVEEVIKGLKDGSIQVFDTDTFTITGKNVKLTKDPAIGGVKDLKLSKDGKVEKAPVDFSYYDFSGKTPKLVFEGKTQDTIKTENGKSFFAESTLRAAPYFSLRIDGIKEID